MCYAPLLTLTLFPTVSAGSSQTRKNKQCTELGTKFVLLPNEVQPPEHKHHSSYSGLCVGVRACFASMPNVWPYLRLRACVFIFCPTDCRHPNRAQMTLTQKTKQTGRFDPVVFCFYIHLICLLDLSAILAISDFHVELHCAGYTGYVPIVDLCSVGPQPPSYSYRN